MQTQRRAPVRARLQARRARDGLNCGAACELGARNHQSAEPRIKTLLQGLVVALDYLYRTVSRLALV